LPNGTHVVADALDGDPCHYNVRGLTNSQGRKLGEKIPLTEVHYCDINNEIKQLTQEIAEKLSSIYQTDEG